MLWTLTELLFNLSTKQITAILAAVAAVATVITLAMPLLSRDNAGQAHERSRARARKTASASASGWHAAEKEKISLRQSPKQYMQQVVERFNLSKMARPGGRAREARAGRLSRPGAYVAFLFFRMVTPIAVLLFALFYLFLVVEWDQPATVKIGVCLAAAYAGMQAPYFFLKNRIAKRQLSIIRAFPDALDLLLICVESGMSIEAAFIKKVSQESVRNRWRWRKS